jgi:curved DNA-binding protein CbpA
MAERSDEDPYLVLGVARGADDETISAARRRLARRHHPDLAGDRATRRMMRINAAFVAIRTADAVGRLGASSSSAAISAGRSAR